MESEEQIRDVEVIEYTRPERLPERLIEEMVVYLFNSKGFLVGKTLDVRHLNLSVFPTPVVRSLYSKSAFYNICLSKILDLTVRNDSQLGRFIEKYIQYDKKLRRFNDIRKVSKKQKVHFVLYCNEYKIDKTEKFIFLDSSRTSSLRDISKFKTSSDFFKRFSEKYPQYYNKYSEGQIITQDKNLLEVLSSSVVDLMKDLHSEDYKERIVLLVDDEGQDLQAQYSLIDSLYDKQ